MRRLLCFLSLLRRHIPYNASIVFDNDTPLGFARYEDETRGPIWIEYKGVKIYSFSESFRRHIIQVGDDFFEIKMPGEEADRDLILPAHFDISNDLWVEGAPLIKPVAMVSTAGYFSLYGKRKKFNNSDLPLNIVVWRFQDGSRLSNVIYDEAYCEKIAQRLNIPVDDLRCRILRQLVLIARWVLEKGYVGHDGELNDWHLENFLLAPDGRLFLVPDFGAYHKAENKLTKGQCALEINQLLNFVSDMDMNTDNFEWTNAILAATKLAQTWTRSSDEQTIDPTTIWSTCGVPIQQVYSDEDLMGPPPSLDEMLRRLSPEESI